MNDFEYSVEICDRDWDCFFAACEECNLLPPSLAGVDDSGMSDIDDTGSILAKSIQKVDLTAGFSEADHPIDAPQDCEGSPVEHYLSTHTVGGMESVLSGSEEDIHLQSVNIFFERLKNVTEAEGLTEPSQVRVGKNREAIKEEERQRASSSTLPKNIPKLNTLPARGETALGKETTETVHTISNNNTMKKDEAGSNISPEPVASKLFKTNKSAHPETKLSLREEICTETRVNEAKQRNGSHDSPDGVVCSQTTPHTDKVMKVNMCTPLDDVNQEHLVTSQSTHSTRCSTDSWSTLEIMSNVKWKEDRTPNSVYSDATNSNKTASQELSPSASIKRKRKKKRRLSAEPAESVHGYDRPVLVKQSDSEEEQYAWRAGSGLCISEDLFYLNEPQKNVMSSLTAYSATTNLPVKISAREIKVNDLSHYSRPSDSHYQCFPESMVRQRRCKETGLVENNATIVSSVTPLSQTDDNVMSAQNGSGNVATNVQLCSKLQAEEPTGLNKYPMLPVSMSDSVIGKSDLATKTANCGRKDAYNLRQSDEMNNSVTCCGNEQNQGSCSAEVKSITHSILPSAESNDPTEKVSQNDKLSTAKSVLAVEAGISGRDNYALCQREAEHQQQLEIDCHNTNQYSSTVKKTHIALSESDMSGSIAHNTKPKQFKTRVCPFSEEISSQLDCIKLISDTRNSLSDNNCLPKSLSSSDIKIAVQQTEHPLVPHTLSRFDVLSEKNTTAERAGLASSQIMSNHSGNLFLSGDKSLTGKSQRETKSSMSYNLLTSPSDITSVSSCCTLDTESVVSLSNENITHMSESSGLSVSQNDSGGQGEKTSLLLARHEEGDGTSGPKSQSVLNETIDSNNDLVVGAEDAITASIAQCESEKAPNSKHSVFAMSSFWSEMEKLTINDILGLRIISKAAPPSSLPPLQEIEETRDSGFFTQLDEQSTKETSTNSVDSSSGSVMAVNSSSSRGMWESEPVTLSRGADVYPESMMLTSVSDISQPVFPGSAQTCLRKISKNVSVHNLHALESQSFSNTWKGQSLQTLDEGELEKVEYFADGHMSKQDKDMDSSSSSTDNYRISLTDIFQYLFGGKQSMPSQSATDNITTCHTGGNSVPETYDHFFSEFDTESFFYPLITAEDQAKEELVPIFSCSRLANRKLQFPEAYDYFFPSSSSDDSSVESDEEDDRGPVRVVTRFSRKSSASQISTDMYEHFFTDSDLRQNFFWKTTFSFRNIRSTGSTVQKQTLSNPLSLVPVRQSGRSLRKTLHPINAAGNQDMMFPDPLLYNLEDRISRQLAQEPFRYEVFQTAVSNPRLDVPLLPLRQSDMCLVCIAFASWVLKTANPQVGDAWKAVLLANVSALSAIRYLRKYVKMEAAANEKKLQYAVPSDS